MKIKTDCKYYTLSPAGVETCKVLKEMVCQKKKCTFFDLTDKEKKRLQRESAENQANEETGGKQNDD